MNIIREYAIDFSKLKDMKELMQQEVLQKYE